MISGESHQTYAQAIPNSTVHDTIYACQDRTDDIRAGVKPTAVLFGGDVRGILSLSAVVFVTCLAIAGIVQSLWYFTVSVCGVLCPLALRLYTINFDDPIDCRNELKVRPLLAHSPCSILNHLHLDAIRLPSLT